MVAGTELSFARSHLGWLRVLLDIRLGLGAVEGETERRFGHGLGVGGDSAQEDTSG